MRTVQNGDETTLDPETVVRSLTDPGSRQLLFHLDEPRTAGELVEECDIPTSTVYRKLEFLVEGGVVGRSTVIDLQGTNATQYHLSWSRIEVTLDDDGTLSATADEESTDLEPIRK